MHHLAQAIPANPGALIGRTSLPDPDHRTVRTLDAPARRAIIHLRRTLVGEGVCSG